MSDFAQTHLERSVNCDVPSLTDSEFHAVSRIAATEAGLSIPIAKKSLVQSRLMKRLRATGFRGYNEYLAFLSNPDNHEERRQVISALTTNVSSFFRERHHFEHFATEVAPRLRTKLKTANGAARIWSAGCSSGQEPYSIAMECLRAIPDAPERDVLILATDIDQAILARAQTGRYTASEISGVADADKQRFLTPSSSGACYGANEDLRRLIRFRELNLHAPWPMRGASDAIFCRNVMIYFDETKQRALWPRFREALSPGGYLYLGHSERIHPIEASGFAAAGVTIYRKA